MNKILFLVLLPFVASAQLLVRPYSQTNEDLETRVRRDFAAVAGQPPYQTEQQQSASDRNRALVHYAVPTMSDRQRLPDVYPDDGVAGGTVTILAAKGEYEPASFVVYPFADLGKVSVEISELKKVEKVGGGGERTGDLVFPKEDLDLAVVKVWYQNGNGWYSYFGDCGKKLCPELLLHDEDLIRVDTKTQSNYARVEGRSKKDEGRSADAEYEWRWINPPRQMEGDGRDDPAPFQPMRPGFADAKKLTSVTLEKGAFKQFVLTAHVKKGTPAGLYRGEIVFKGGLKRSNNQTIKQSNNQTILSIPVELQVLDFDLPTYPGTYADPTREFMTANYGYLSVPLIMKWNGGDEALARKQFVAICRNLVSHNQSLLKNRAYAGEIGGADFEATLKIMREAGMRSDVYLCGLYPKKFGFPDEHRDELAAHARCLRAYAERKLGHHNVILGFGDEPGQSWVVANRPTFEAYQRQGFKFLIAGCDNVFLRGGHFYDWHNISKDPIDDSTTRLWNQMADQPIVAWYSTMHVGPENPAFNRRQYGMAPYLAGYGAVCNYAHHLGPYNDDSTTYRPMMFFYGTADGVLDTLAWEGFREGLDDIRYATVLSTYARAAVATKRRDGRVLGNGALHFLATFDRASGDLNYCRAEMIDRILKLKRFLGKDAPVVAPKIPSFDPDPTAEAYAPPENPSAEQLKADLRHDEASAKFEAEGRIVEAARAIYNDGVYKGGAYVDDEPRLERLYRRILAERLGTPAERRQAGAWLLSRGCADMKKVEKLGGGGEWTVDAVLKEAIGEGKRATNDFYRVLSGFFFGRDYAGESRPLSAPAYGNWQIVLAVEKLADAVASVAKVPVYNYREVIAFTRAHAATGDLKAVPPILARGLANKRLKPVERAELELVAELAAAPAPERVKAAVEKTLRGLKPDERLKAFDRAGTFVNYWGDEKLLRAMVAIRPQLPSLVDKKRYTVRYSAKAISGGRDMDDAAIEAQPFVRKFGTQSMQFMETDVASGNRGQAAAAVDGAKPSELRVVADDWGLHIRLDAFDPRAKEFAAGLKDFGSFESYLAPGANQPYTCFVQRLKNPSDPSVYSTTYSTPGHRRIDPKNPNLYRNEIYFTDAGGVAYLALAWENFATLVPAKGTVWDFESINWGPTKSAWNGAESIHGRSTWGELVFDLPEAARIKILRRQIHLAVRAFRGEWMPGESIHGKLGFAHRWTDPELGDPVFYCREVKPLVDRLEAAAQRATADMDDATVKDLAENYLQDWRDLRFTIQRLRTKFLELRTKDQLGDEPKGFTLPYQAKAICIDPPATKNLGRFCDFITKRLGPDGFKTLVLRVRYRYRFESHPECRGTDPLSKDDLAKIAAACKAAGVKLVPKMNLLSHQEGLADGTVREGLLKAHPEFDECRERGGKVRSQSRHVICPSSKEAQKIALDLALELAGACGAATFHLGCDEALDFGLCPACHAAATKWGGKGNAQLFADWVNGLNRGLKAKGVSTMIWADRLAACDVMRLDAFQASDNGTWRALPLLDKDIVLCDWHYWPAEGYPSVDLLQDAGFTTWAAVWNNVRGLKVFLDYVKKHDRGKIAGVMFTSWYGADRFLDALDGRLKLTKAEDPDGKIAVKVAGEAEVYNWLRK